MMGGERKRRDIIKRKRKEASKMRGGKRKN